MAAALHSPKWIEPQKQNHWTEQFIGIIDQRAVLKRYFPWCPFIEHTLCTANVALQTKHRRLMQKTVCFTPLSLICLFAVCVLYCLMRYLKKGVFFLSGGYTFFVCNSFFHLTWKLMWRGRNLLCSIASFQIKHIFSVRNHQLLCKIFAAKCHLRAHFYVCVWKRLAGFSWYFLCHFIVLCYIYSVVS